MAVLYVIKAMQNRQQSIDRQTTCVAHVNCLRVGNCSFTGDPSSFFRCTRIRPRNRMSRGSNSRGWALFCKMPLLLIEQTDMIT